MSVWWTSLNNKSFFVFLNLLCAANKLTWRQGRGKRSSKRSSIRFRKVEFQWNFYGKVVGFISVISAKCIRSNGLWTCGNSVFALISKTSRYWLLHISNNASMMCHFPSHAFHEWTTAKKKRRERKKWLSGTFTAQENVKSEKCCWQLTKTSFFLLLLTGFVIDKTTQRLLIESLMRRVKSKQANASPR